MKFTLALLCISIGASATNPETILPKTKELKPVYWYATQETAWSAFVSNNPKSADGWLNYYSAARYAQEDTQILDGIVNRMTLEVPNTYEYHLVKGWHGGFTTEAVSELTQAYELNPTNAGSYG